MFGTLPRSPRICRLEESRIKQESMLRGFTLVAMMKTANLRDLNNLVFIFVLYRSGLRRVLAKRSVSSRKGVVVKVTLQDSSQMPLSDNDHMIKAFSSNNQGILFEWSRSVARRSRFAKGFLEQSTLPQCPCFSRSSRSSGHRLRPHPGSESEVQNPREKLPASAGPSSGRLDVR